MAAISSRDIGLRAYKGGVSLDFSAPAKPTDIDARNCKLRSECVTIRWFLSLEDVCEKLDRRRTHYNGE